MREEARRRKRARRSAPEALNGDSVCPLSWLDSQRSFRAGQVEGETVPSPGEYGTEVCEEPAYLSLPQTEDEHAREAELLRDTAGFVVDLRGEFQRQFEAFEAGASRMRAHTKLPLRPNFIGFSDSFVTSVPLRNDCGDLVRVVTVFSALSAAANRDAYFTGQKPPASGRN
jgi:hypothetical protein